MAKIPILKYDKYIDIFAEKKKVSNSCESYSYFCSKNINVFKNTPGSGMVVVVCVRAGAGGWWWCVCVCEGGGGGWWWWCVCV